MSFTKAGSGLNAKLRGYDELLAFSLAPHFQPRLLFRVLEREIQSEGSDEFWHFSSIFHEVTLDFDHDRGERPEPDIW